MEMLSRLVANMATIPLTDSQGTQSGRLLRQTVDLVFDLPPSVRIAVQPLTGDVVVGQAPRGRPSIYSRQSIKQVEQLAPFFLSVRIGWLGHCSLRVIRRTKSRLSLGPCPPATWRRVALSRGLGEPGMRGALHPALLRRHCSKWESYQRDRYGIEESKTSTDFKPCARSKFLTPVFAAPSADGPTITFRRTSARFSGKSMGR